MWATSSCANAGNAADSTLRNSEVSSSVIPGDPNHPDPRPITPAAAGTATAIAAVTPNPIITSRLPDGRCRALPGICSPRRASAVRISGVSRSSSRTGAVLRKSSRSLSIGPPLFVSARTWPHARRRYLSRLPNSRPARCHGSVAGCVLWGEDPLERWNRWMLRCGPARGSWQPCSPATDVRVRRLAVRVRWPRHLRGGTPVSPTAPWGSTGSGCLCCPSLGVLRDNEAPVRWTRRDKRMRADHGFSISPGPHPVIAIIEGCGLTVNTLREAILAELRTTPDTAGPPRRFPLRRNHLRTMSGTRMRRPMQQPPTTVDGPQPRNGASSTARSNARWWRRKSRFISTGL